MYIRGTSSNGELVGDWRMCVFISVSWLRFQMLNICLAFNAIISYKRLNVFNWHICYFVRLSSMNPCFTLSEYFAFKHHIRTHANTHTQKSIKMQWILVKCAFFVFCCHCIYLSSHFLCSRYPYFEGFQQKRFALAFFLFQFGVLFDSIGKLTFQVDHIACIDEKVKHFEWWSFCC